jgi:hypothetical protein
MAYRNSPAPRLAKNELVLGVGWHAYVNWSPPAGHSWRPVPMTDGAGAQVRNDLVDGQEVEILSWRPRSRDGLAYQIRRLSDGSEWWIAATYLRRLAAPTPVPPPLERVIEVAAKQHKG